MNRKKIIWDSLLLAVTLKLFKNAICAVIYISRTFFSSKEVRLSEKATCNIISPHPTILSGNTISETAYKGQD